MTGKFQDVYYNPNNNISSRLSKDFATMCLKMVLCIQQVLENDYIPSTLVCVCKASYLLFLHAAATIYRKCFVT